MVRGLGALQLCDPTYAPVFDHTVNFHHRVFTSLASDEYICGCTRDMGNRSEMENVTSLF